MFQNLDKIIYEYLNPIICFCKINYDIKRVDDAIKRKESKCSYAKGISLKLVEY